MSFDPNECEINFAREFQQQLDRLTEDRRVLAEALMELAQCDLREDNCFSFEVANARIRAIARAALERVSK